MVVSGSLLEGMQRAIDSLAVLVIDEFDLYSTNIVDRFSHLPTENVTWAQQRVIMLAQRYNCPIFLIQMDKKLPSGSYYYNQDSNLAAYDSVTSRYLRVLMPPITRVINKHSANAFTNTNLSLLLAQQYQCEGVKDLVVMGRYANMCVCATIGPTKRFGWVDEPLFGATDYGFTVHTCQQVLHGNDVVWANNSPLIRFYSHL